MRADRQTVWDVLADFGSIHDWLPGVDHSCVLATAADGPVGTARRVQMGRMTLVETITEFDAPAALAYDIAGLPRWLRHFDNRWTLQSAGPGATTVTVTSTVDLGPGRLRTLAARVLCLLLGRLSSDTMLAGLAARSETAHA
ncbi:MxaD family protein [Mycolicibacterium litorale]|uniref:MxaD family protein n=1 Tax=Mycolicibacterium litorale TaxID=758802 RepID=A0A6S6NWT7_9MYCO|nr:SRPBCC family protein [Mycolicibacterium litorale]BCI51663.1 MxaD family protein [Mycolicibacterium litorale]